jgi:hypothetical protein
MSIFGFPSTSELTEMMGYVTDEDHARWDSMKESSDKRREAARTGQTAKGLASQGVAPALGMAEKNINAQIHGEQMAERQRRRQEDEVEVTQTETRKSFRPRFDGEQGKKSNGGPEMGF